VVKIRVGVNSNEGCGARHRQRPAHGLHGGWKTKHLAARMEEITDPGASYNKGVVKFRKVKIRTL
jgi:hypothetical protein